MIHTRSCFGVALALTLATFVAPSRAESGTDVPAQQFPRIEKYGAVVWVCGQSVVRGGNPLTDVMPGIRVAHSAMIFNMNRQADGWASLGVH
ncbi:MAG: hypothetical protein NTW36_10770 [Planctomycetia bacterium]|jgi:intracellular sulfur oxidation DsrE/DsrF family protein|nr:hypothetical protein [Planctomycetia bacterium]